jgi:hypothetical protein
MAEAFSKITRLFEDIFNEIMAFEVMCGFFINVAHFERRGGFCLEMWSYYKDFNYC